MKRFSALWAAVIAAMVFVACAVASATTLVYVPGTKESRFLPSPPVNDLRDMDLQLKGWPGKGLDAQVDTTILIDYPMTAGLLTGFGDLRMNDSIAISDDKITAVVSQTDDSMVFLAYSQGAISMSNWLRANANGINPDAPPADKLSIYLIGNPESPTGILTRLKGWYIPIVGVTAKGPTPENQYSTVNIIREYDFYAHFPEDPTNILALINLVAGFATIHGDYKNVDIDAVDNITQVSGSTVHVMVPSKELPLAALARQIVGIFGIKKTPIIDALEPILKIVVDSAYSDDFATPRGFRIGSSIPRLLTVLAQSPSPIHVRNEQPETAPGGYVSAKPQQGKADISTPAVNELSDSEVIGGSLETLDLNDFIEIERPESNESNDQHASTSDELEEEKVIDVATTSEDTSESEGKSYQSETSRSRKPHLDRREADSEAASAAGQPAGNSDGSDSLS